MSAAKTVHSFDPHAAALRGAGAAILGTLAWYAVPDLRVSLSTVEGLVRSHGLGRAPKLANSADAFRRATSPQTRRGENRAKRYLVRPVVNSGETLVRHIVVERVNARDEKLSHDALAELRYTEATEAMTADLLPWMGDRPADEEAEVRKMMDECRALYSEYRGMLTGPELRRFVARQLDAMSRVTVHPHGHVYFVPRTSSGEIAALAGFVRGLAPYAVDKDQPPQFWSLPVQDVPDHREMVGSGFRSTMLGDLAQVAGEIREMLAGDGEKWTIRRAMSKVETIADAREKAKLYRATVGVHVEEVNAMIEIMAVQAAELVSRAETAAG